MSSAKHSGGRQPQHPGKETEIKIAVPNLRSVARKLLRLGFQCQSKRTFEANLLLDTEQTTLRSKGQLLRLRQYGKRWVLTFKGTAESGRHKTREELEIDLADPDTAKKIIERLGFRPTFRYEKYRSEYTDRHGVVTLDETPIGNYIELEGEPGWIDLTAERLGYADSDYLTKSYGRLYLEYCEGQGLQPGQMTF